VHRDLAGNVLLDAADDPSQATRLVFPRGGRAATDALVDEHCQRRKQHEELRADGRHDQPAGGTPGLKVEHRRVGGLP
jgi:hypothetical protein